MLRFATAILLIITLLGCPFICLAESAENVRESTTDDPCTIEVIDNCTFDSQDRPPHDRAPCDHDECPDSDCMCAGAIVCAPDDVAADGDEQIVWLDVKACAGHGALVATLPEFRLLPNGLISPDAQRRCALIGAFLL